MSKKTSDDKPKTVKPETRGGSGRGAGRPKGSKNKLTTKLEQHMAKLLDEAIANNEKDITSLDLLQTIYRDRHVPVAIRQAAMKAALPYEAPKYQPLPPTPEQSGNGGEGSGGSSNPQRMSHARDSLRRKLIKTVQPRTGGQVGSNPQ